MFQYLFRMSRITPIKTIDLAVIEDVLEMGSGYVLNFSDKTFAQFFQDEVGIIIDQEKYLENGTSKANRMRTYLRSSTNKDRVATLEALWDYRDFTEEKGQYTELSQKVKNRFFKIIETLKEDITGSSKRSKTHASTKIISDSDRSSLMAKLIKTTSCEPHKRGYEFEKFLSDFFNAYGLQSRGPFSLTGEQIDGSFVHDTHTYLLEAKWTAAKTNAETLRAFDAKVKDKADWSRGLFVSQTGFTEVGLSAFGRGKRIVCIDGLDITDILQGMTSLNEALILKVRNAAETGRPFVRVRDLI